jgi:hypothetical protein
MQDVLGQLASSPAIGAALTVLAIGAVALWLAAAWWTYQDMGRRSDSEVAALGAVAWILLSTPALLLLSLPTYLLARPQQTAAQGRSQALVLALQSSLVEAILCPGCGTRGEPDWRRCPTCATWLETDCDACGRWSSVRLDVCPWCATERPALGDAGVLIGLPSLQPATKKAAGAERAAARHEEPARRRQVPARLG